MGKALDAMLAEAGVPAGPLPTIGRIVHYRLSEQDAERINARRLATRERLAHTTDPGLGFQPHAGNRAEPGATYPMLIVAVWGAQPTSLVNGQVFLDGNDVHWATSVSTGTGPGTWSWPPRA